MYEGENRIYIGVLVAAGIIIIMIAVFLYLAAKYHRSRRLLHARQVIAGIEAIEKDRKRIAADLHDEIGSLLTCVKLKVSSLPAEGLVAEELTAVRHHLNAMHDSLLAITNDLMPNSLSRNGLLGALEEFISDTESRLPSGIGYQVSRLDENRIPASWKIHIYRIVTELVQNTIKHSGATRMCLSLTGSGNQLTIRFSDNGCGFDTGHSMLLKPGTGLKNINSRISIMGGKLKLRTGNDKGVKYEFQIPLQPAASAVGNC